MTHCIDASVVCRPASIPGRATLTTDSSTNAMVEPRTATANTQGLFCRGQGAVPRADRMISAAQGCAFNLTTRCRPWPLLLTDNKIHKSLEKGYSVSSHAT